MNPWVSSYANPVSQGLPANYYPNSGIFGAPSTATPTFGKALYPATSTTTSTGVNATSSQTPAGFSTIGIPRAPVYSTVLSEDMPVVMRTPPELLANVRDSIDRSTYFDNRGKIQIDMVGTTVKLSGQVESAKERRIAEGLVRMTPGVRDVQNDLVVLKK
jgi:hypothetical protein